MIKYMRGDPVRIISFIIAVIIGIFMAKGMIAERVHSADDCKNIFREGFITSTEEKISLKLGKDICLSEENKEALGVLFDRNVNIGKLKELLNEDGKRMEEIQNSENYIDVVISFMSNDDRKIYEKFLEEACSVTEE